MDALTVQPEVILAVTAALAFALGWTIRRWLSDRRERHDIELLNLQIARLEQQRDAAHRVALDLAARHAQLHGNPDQAESIVLSPDSDPGYRRKRAERVTDGYDVHISEVNEATWTAPKLVSNSVSASP